ncbi:MAG: hypothetical protein NTW28_37905 [Candidatus Solibacter sp.]|nr:hypothetical protein [Candidatus Solibacter sp.]
MRLPCKLMFAPVAALLFATALGAQDTTELLNRMKAMEDRIHALETEVRTLKGQQTPVAPQPQPAAEAAPVVAQAPPAPVSIGGAGGAAAKVLNPDISVIGDFVGAAGNHGGRATPSLSMHESEVGFQEVIDPYARADFFLSFGEQGVNLEEGFITFTSLPAGLQLKAGKMRAAFGKVNTLHNHVLPWIDRPLVSQNLVGGEDGINDAGLSLSRILPSPKGLFLEGTAQIFRGDSENVFAATRRSQVAAVGHLRAYSDLSESTNIDFGASYARGHSPFADGNNQLYGLDATLRWKPLRRAIYHSLMARSEFVWARTSTSLPYLTGIPVVTPAPDPVGSMITQVFTVAPRGLAKPFGFYVSGDYQLGRRWILGSRFDRSQRGQCLPTNPTTTASECPYTVFAPGVNFSRAIPLLQDTGGSFQLTYLPSEFSIIRTQFRRARYGEGRTANEILFQFQFSMGAHGAHPF